MVQWKKIMKKGTLMNKKTSIKKKNSNNKNEILKLGIIFAICLAVLVVLIVMAVQLFGTTPASNPDKPQYVELPNIEGMNLAKAKILLDNADVQFEIVPTNSKTPNRVEKVEYVGKEENEKTFIEVGTKVKIYSNEVAKDKVVYLTFDDGPTRDNTNDIVFTLQEYGIKASFFVEGRDVERYPDRMEAIFNRGHVIACHSHTHEYEAIYSSTDAFINEVEQYEAAMIEAIGEENFAQVKKIIRFPGGTNNSYLESKENALAYISAVRTLGYTVYDWTALTGDAELDDRNSRNLISYLDSSLEKAKNKGLDLIILMHDNIYTNEALVEILYYLVEKGYYFDTIDNCPEYTFAEN